MQSVRGRSDEATDWQDVVGQASGTSATRLTSSDGHRLTYARAGTDDMDHDDDWVFGRLVVRELRHITDTETKLLLRHDILTVIYEARLAGLHQLRRPGINIDRNSYFLQQKLFSIGMCE